ncbi:GGDEF domain-containing protein [Winogradskya consettensis]|nr:GGDEF domain-containing protein [Actinoplanes consettensis]
MKCLTARSVLLVGAVAALVTAAAPGAWYSHWVYLVMYGTAVAVGWWRLRTFRGAARGSFVMIMVAESMWLAGDVLYDVVERLTPDLGDVTPSDALWIAGNPILAAGLLRLARRRSAVRLRNGLLDGLTMATVVAWLFGQYVVLPAAQNQRLSPEVALAVLYPLTDVLLFVAVVVLVLSPGAKGGPGRFLIAAVVLELVGDLLESTGPVIFPAISDATISRFDGILLLGNVLFISTVLHRDAERFADPRPDDRRLHPARVVFLGVALLTFPIMAALVTVSLAGRISLICSAVLLTGLILARFLLVVREQERTQAILAHQAGHDMLTGLANRPALIARLTTELVQPVGYGPVVCYLDLNGFKQVNDGYGHAAGDLVLVEIADRLTRALRPGDLAARLGGDEFVVVAVDATGEGDASALVERLRDLIAGPVRDGDREYEIGASIGVAAAADLTDPTADTLLAAADAGMYAEKAARRTLLGAAGQ